MPQRNVCWLLKLKSVLSGSFGEERVLSALHFFRSHIFNVRGDAPLLAERVGNFSIAVAPEHILQRHINPSASCHSAVKNFVRVRDIQMKVYGIADPLAGAWYRRFAHCVVEEEFRVPDLQFRVHDFAVGPKFPAEFGGAKGSLVIFDGARRIRADKVRRHGAESFGDGFYLVWHRSLLLGFSGRGSAALIPEPGAFTEIVRLRPRRCQYVPGKIHTVFT